MTLRGVRRHWRAQGVPVQEEAERPPVFEYRSRAAFLGLPLVHIRIDGRFATKPQPVKAWIASGHFAVGGLLAFGGVSIAPVALGLCGVGLLPLAGIALGAVPLGAIAIGGWAYGGLAIGWEALGCFAFAWDTAIGNIALAWRMAFGHFAWGALVNDDAARTALKATWFSKWGYFVERWSLLLNLLWITPLFVQWRLIARRKA
jgi:hypothetical protein